MCNDDGRMNSGKTTKRGGEAAKEVTQEGCLPRHRCWRRQRQRVSEDRATGVVGGMGGPRVGEVVKISDLLSGISGLAGLRAFEFRL